MNLREHIEECYRSGDEDWRLLIDIGDDHRSIIEGRCPRCSGPLERRIRDGWCGTCEVGWAIAGNTVTVTFPADLREWRRAADGRA